MEGPEFGSDQAKETLVVWELYGLYLYEAYFRTLFDEQLHDLGKTP